MERPIRIGANDAGFNSTRVRRFSLSERPGHLPGTVIKDIHGNLWQYVVATGSIAASSATVNTAVATTGTYQGMVTATATGGTRPNTTGVALKAGDHFWVALGEDGAPMSGGPGPTASIPA